MNKLCIIYIFLLTSLVVSAQELKVTDVELLDGDSYAVDNPRYDNNNVLCAVLKVYFNQEEYGQLKFSSPLMLGDASYKSGCYTVYVADKTKNLTLRSKISTPFTINFRDYGISIERGKTYRIDVNAIGLKNTETVVFNMLPLNGLIDVDGKKWQVVDGALQIELPSGSYRYKAYDDKGYYISTEGDLRVSESSISETKIIPIKLEQRMARVIFKCNDENAILYVDNTEYGTPGEKLLPWGEHNVRVEGLNHKSYSDKFVVNSDSKEWDIKLVNSSVPIKITSDTGWTNLFIDNKMVNWREGKTINVKPGKHLFTLSKTSTARGKKNRIIRKIRVDYNTTIVELRKYKQKDRGERQETAKYIEYEESHQQSNIIRYEAPNGPTYVPKEEEIVFR